MSAAQAGGTSASGRRRPGTAAVVPLTGAQPMVALSRTGPQAVVVGPHTGAQAVIADAIDPARRPDVLFRVRRDDDHQVSAWWLVGAFVAVSGAVIALLSFIPGGV